MREIKFRAFNKLEGKMHLSPSSYKGLQHLGSWFEAQSIYGFNNDGENIVMQFTGLKDKNGVEIYEGDVVEIKHPFQGRTHKGIVEYMDYWFGVKGFYFTHFDNPPDIFSEGMRYIEVIGNMYEQKL